MSTNSRSAETPRPLRTRLHAGHLALALIAAVPSCGGGDGGSGPAAWSLGAETFTAVANDSTLTGGPPIDQRCTDGSVGVGYTGRHGTLIDNLQLLCAELRADGTLGTLSTSPAIGTSSGGGAFSTECAPDSLALTVLVGDRGKYDTGIQTFQGQCLRPADVAAGAANDASVRTTAPVGADIGSPYTLFCPHGSAVTGLRGREMVTGFPGVVAAIGLICREIHDG